jgi:type II secretory pathway component HofQ
MRSVLCIAAALAAGMLAGDRARADEPAKPGAMVSLEVAAVELTPVEEAVGFVDLGEDPAAKVAELEKQGRIASLTRIQLTTLENQPAELRVSEQTPTVTGRTRVGGGRGAPPGATPGFATSFTFQNVGSQLQVTPKVAADGSVLVELKFEQSRLSPPIVQGEGAEFTPQGPATTSTMTTIAAPPGKTVVVGGFQATERTEGREHAILSQSFLLLSAKVEANP